MHACNTWTFRYKKNLSVIAINQKEEVAVFIIQILRFIICYTNLYLHYKNHSTIFYGIIYTTDESSLCQHNMVYMWIIQNFKIPTMNDPYKSIFHV